MNYSVNNHHNMTSKVTYTHLSTLFIERLIVLFSQEGRRVIDDAWTNPMGLHESKANGFKLSKEIIDLCCNRDIFKSTVDGLNFIYSAFLIHMDICYAFYIATLDKLAKCHCLNYEDFILLGPLYLHKSSIFYKASCVNTYLNIFYELANPLLTRFSYSCVTRGKGVCCHNGGGGDYLGHLKLYHGTAAHKQKTTCTHIINNYDDDDESSSDSLLNDIRIAQNKMVPDKLNTKYVRGFISVEHESTNIYEKYTFLSNDIYREHSIHYLKILSYIFAYYMSYIFHPSKIYKGFYSNTPYSNIVHILHSANENNILTFCSSLHFDTYYIITMHFSEDVTDITRLQKMLERGNITLRARNVVNRSNLTDIVQYKPMSENVTCCIVGIYEYLIDKTIADILASYLVG